MIRRFLLLLALLLSTPPVAADRDGFTVISGDWQQGALIVAKLRPGAQLWFEERSVRVSAEGFAAIGLHRDQASPVRLRLRDDAAPERQLEFAVTQRQWAVQRIDGLPQAMVEPPAALQQRIADDAERVRAARALDTPRIDFAQGFGWPAQGRVSSVYGSQRILNGVPKQPHYGIDIAAPTGAAVVATAAGVVRLAETDQYYTGGTVIIDHGGGVSSTYLHLSRLRVSVGEAVASGERIGDVGASGRATGPHLCFRINWFDARLDPLLLLDAAAAN